MSMLKIFFGGGEEAVFSPSMVIRQGSSAVSTILAAIALLGLAGCSTITESPYPLKDGWRAAKIEEVGPGAKLEQVPALEDCRMMGTLAQRQADRFAVVSYWSIVPLRKFPSGWIPRIVSLDATSSLSAGDAVYVNIFDCNMPVVVRKE